MNFDKINNYRKLADEYMINALKAPIPALSGMYDAMLYSVKNGGKRVRPVLAMMFCEASGGNPESAGVFFLFQAKADFAAHKAGLLYFR